MVGLLKKMTKKNVAKLKTLFDHLDGVSQNQADRKFKCHMSLVNKTLKTKTEIRCKKKKIPEQTDAQKQKARERCGRLLRKFQGCSWIIDDESYFTLKHSTINGNDNFYSSDVSLTSASVKYNPTAKFDK